jgi:hypothetical protein
VSRLEKVKRIDLAIDAMARARGTQAGGGGDGSERGAGGAHRSARARRSRAAGGAVEDAELIELLAGARRCSTPFEEDYGYVTLEAFLARKPVITTTDAGGRSSSSRTVNGWSPRRRPTRWPTRSRARATPPRPPGSARRRARAHASSRGTAWWSSLMAAARARADGWR